MESQKKSVSGVMRYEQHIVIEWHNGPAWIEHFVSDNPITIDKVAAHAASVWDFNEDRDSITFVDPPDPSVKIGECDDVTDTPHLDAYPDTGDDDRYGPDDPNNGA